MEKELKEYFMTLCDNFWEEGNNPKIKSEFGYDEFDGTQKYDWFLNVLCPKYQPELFDPNLSVLLYKFYASVVEDEPKMTDFLAILPLSYHKSIIENCADAFEALEIIVKTIENDWTKCELIDYFSLLKN